MKFLLRLWSCTVGLVVLLACLSPRQCVAEQPSPAAQAAFDAYVRAVEQRLAEAHRSPEAFLVMPSARAITTPAPAASPGNQLAIERLTPQRSGEYPGALLHHWRGTAFAPGATVADFERLTRDLSAYPRVFAPEVLQAQLLSTANSSLEGRMRVRQHHLLTVVTDITYQTDFARLDPQHASSLTRSLSIDEVANPGTPNERILSAQESHGFLWRLNTYWSYERKDGGLYLQIESVSLTRSIPNGLGWAVGPFTESIPRESLEFTLRCVLNGLRK